LPEEAGDGSLRYRNAHFAQLAMDPWRSPERVRGGHLAHERANGGVGTRAARATPSRAPRPSPAEPLPMPSHHGVGLDEYERRAPVPPRFGQHDPKQPISRPELRTGDAASQRIELLAEREVFEDQLVMSAAGQRQRANDDNDHLRHASILSFYMPRINRSAVRS
jgi:hypothetical protein